MTIQVTRGIKAVLLEAYILPHISGAMVVNLEHKHYIEFCDGLLQYVVCLHVDNSIGQLLSCRVLNIHIADAYSMPTPAKFQ